MARGGSPDLQACEELQRASVGLRIVYLELRGALEERVYPVVTTPGVTLAAAAMGARVRLSEREATELVDEGAGLGLWVLRARDDGAQELAIASLPPTVYRARYGAKRGPRGGKSDAERAREARAKKKADELGAGAGERTSTAPGEERPSAPPSELPADLTTRDASRDVTGNVTAPGRDASRNLSVTPPPPPGPSSPPPGTPPKGGAGEGGREPRPGEVGGGGKAEREAFEETGRWTVEKLGEDTAKVFDPAAIRAELRHLGRAVLQRGWGAAELELVAAWWRAEPVAWRTALPGAKGALLVTVAALLGDRIDNHHTASGLAACLAAARAWDRRRAAPPAPGPGPARVEASDAPRLNRAEIEARSRAASGDPKP